METTPTQNRASTGRFRKSPARIFFIALKIAVLIGILAVVLHIVAARLINKYYYPDSITYENSESMINVFLNNEKSFTEIAQMLQENREFFDYLRSIDRKVIYFPIPQRKKYLTEEEYKLIWNFFSEYGPIQIGSRYGEFNNIWFCFFCTDCHLTLYYTEETGKELSIFLSRIRREMDAQKIDDNWYYGITPYQAP